MRSALPLAFAALLLLVSAGGSSAQTDDEPEPAGIEAIPAPIAPPPFEPNAAFFVVEGVASNDLLNVRATASAMGKVVGRLPNGVLLRNHGCSETNGVNWCEVESTEDRGLRGWVAARYMRATSVEGAGLESLPAENPPAGEGASSEQAALPGQDAPVVPSPSTGGDATPGADAVGDIPCARYYGQPMTHCSAHATRGEDGEATVTVTWPDGGQRVILFTNGRADNSDSPDPLTYTREADLNMIRIGKAERFEIPDTLPFGG
ncbi:SH3 domain-containing protein [Mesorhizobium sp. ASY16-5R]|uniref:SH3 domain-containing protein n=1 Tax=Mesorhizobium sp. ASY16-5R TaxID=3445772 RepID=UPI003F9FA51E